MGSGAVIILSVLKEFGKAANVQKYSNYNQLENQVVVKGICTFKDWGRMILLRSGSQCPMISNQKSLVWFKNNWAVGSIAFIYTSKKQTANHKIWLPYPQPCFIVTK